jgi:hypothetical protein
MRTGMQVRRLVRLAVALAFAALVVAACGEDVSRDEYVAGLRRVKSHLDDAADASLASGQATDPKEKRAKLDEAHAALEQAADEAESLEAPTDALEANEDFAKALRDYADLYGRLAELKPNDPQETQLYTEAGDIAERLDRASQKLAKAGYRVRTKEQDE